MNIEGKEIYFHIGLHKTGSSLMRDGVLPLMDRKTIYSNTSDSLAIAKMLMDYVKAGDYSDPEKFRCDVLPDCPQEKIVIRMTTLSGNPYSGYP